MADSSEGRLSRVVIRILAPVIAVAIGVGVYLYVRHAEHRSTAQLYVQVTAVIVGAMIAIVPPLRRAAMRSFDRLKSPGESARAWITLAIWLGSAVHFIAVANSDGRLLPSPIHDELAFRTQITFLSHGRLWMPAHPLADFFETFHILDKPVYSPVLFPGTSLLYVPAAWVGMPLWIFSGVIGGGVVALIYRVSAELLDGGVGLLAALLAICNHWTGIHSARLLPYLPALLLELGALWAFLHWRRRKTAAWAMCMGALAGWAAITRPVDALCFFIPLGIWFLRDLGGTSRSVWPRIILAAGLAAAPFLALQLVFDHGVTGHYLQSPFGYYLDQKLPGLEFSLSRHFDLDRRPESKLPQFQAYYLDWMVPMLKTNHQTPLGLLWVQRLPDLATGPLPTPVLVALIPLGLLPMVLKRCWVIVATLPLFVVLYSFYGVFIATYFMALMPVALMAIAASPRAVGPFAGALAAAIAVTTLSGLAMVHGGSLITANNTQLTQIDHLLDLNVRRPAIVLFRYVPGADEFQEPVYNPEVLWPDESPIIRAHDLGSRDGELLKYFCAVAPEREVYRFDRGTEDLVDLGSVKQLLEIGWQGD